MCLCVYVYMCVFCLRVFFGIIFLKHKCTVRWEICCFYFLVCGVSFCIMRYYQRRYSQRNPKMHPLTRLCRCVSPGCTHLQLDTSSQIRPCSTLVNLFINIKAHLSICMQLGASRRDTSGEIHLSIPLCSYLMFFFFHFSKY